MTFEELASTARKGQSAIEYLTTYGWALLAIVIVGAVLMQMGIFSGQCPTSDTFTSSDVGFGDWAISDGDIVMSVDNRQSSQITLQNVTFYTDGGEAFSWTGSQSVAGGQTSDTINASAGSQDVSGCSTLDVLIHYELESLGENVTESGQATREF
ncbi:MAG: hypothetical protein MUP66_02275 [Candidatus Nanohaloarchaeota archaeon QJJ-5]|nr:hypothetical protein [Candidatus Nanohaloarchaeota archaeon QJJ-5]